jgi:probable HAF family extracellular repeat protein
MAACLYTEHGMVRIVPGSDYGSYARGISSNGTVVGDIGEQSGIPLFRFRDANGNGQSDPGELTLQPQQDPTSWVWPCAINDSGDAVGRKISSNPTVLTAALWSGSEILDLNDLVAPGSGLTLREALDINEAGQIVGRAQAADGSGRAFLLTPATGGDANLDGAVNVGDLGILALNWSQSGKTWLQADFTGEGTVDLGDLGVLAANWGWVRAPGGAGAVPEPAGLILLAAGGLELVRRRR